MRAWKLAETPNERIFLYFREHADKFFAPEHIAAQVGVSERVGRQIIGRLEIAGKIESVDTVASENWGRPRRMYRATRTSRDSLRQLEAFPTIRRRRGKAVGT